jgi:adenylate cyclase
VGITDRDIREIAGNTPDDRVLARVLEKIAAGEPDAIGLDIIRDIPVPPGTVELQGVFERVPRIYGVGNWNGEEGDNYFERVAPPPALARKRQVGDVGVVVDEDGVVRRLNLFPAEIPSLGVIVAHAYLKQRGIIESTNRDGYFKLGNVVFPRLTANDGGYVGADDAGYQSLMRWRTPPQGYVTVPMGDVLRGTIPDSTFRDKIVLVGYTTTTFKKDLFEIPFSRYLDETPRQAFGVEIQAAFAGYILESVLDGTPTLRGVPEPLENLWIALCLTSAALGTWWFGRKPIFGRALAIALSIGVILSIIFYYLLVWLFGLGYWLPAFTSLAAVWVAVVSTLLYISREKNIEYVESLESKIEERTKFLSEALRELELAREKMIRQEKLAFLGRLTAGFSHQIKNPIYLLKYGLEIIEENLLGEITESSLQESLKFTRSLREQTEKLELLFKLILLSPSSRQAILLEISPNIFIKTIIDSVFKYHISKIPTSICELNLSEDLDRVYKIPKQLEIPLFNVIENALDALFEMRKLDINFLPSIKIITLVIDSNLKIEIEDNGGGIAKEIQNTLFEAFTTTKEEYGGLGLGLYISQEIIKDLKGSIGYRFTNEITKFIIEIPLFN